MSSTEPSEKGDDFSLNFINAGHFEGSKQLQHVKVSAKLTWTIDEFLTWAELQEKTYCQTSTTYKMEFEKIGKTFLFSFDLYPKGDAKSEDDIALYIKNLSDENLNVIFKLQLLKKNGEPFEEKFSEQVLVANGSRGWRRFVSKKRLQDDPETLLPGGALVILCDLTIYSSEVINTCQNVSEPDEISQDSTELWKDMGQLLDVAAFSDVSLVAGETNFACHKNILTCRSDVFRAMFKAEMAMANFCNEVIIKEFEPDIVAKMVEYIYTDELKHSDDFNSIELLLLSDKYNIVGLRRKCEKALAKNLTLANAIPLLSVAHRISAPTLMKSAAIFIGRNLKTIVGSEDWNKLLRENPVAMDAIIKFQTKWI